MSCKNCENGCPASEITGKNCDPVEEINKVCIDLDNDRIEDAIIKMGLYVNNYHLLGTGILEVKGENHTQCDQ